jgi:hypothetical protein
MDYVLVALQKLEWTPGSSEEIVGGIGFGQLAK